MAAIWVLRSQLQGRVTELAGLRSGLALSARAIDEKVMQDKECGACWHGDVGDFIRIRSEEYDQLFCALLIALGAAPPDVWTLPMFYLQERFRHDPPKSRLAHAMLDRYLAWAPHRPTRTEFVTSALEEFGPSASSMAELVYERIRLHFLVSPWAAFTEHEWSDTIPLSDLFRSERISATHGRFLDQRFIDYLAANFEDIGRIHWRKFEALAAEHFHREGCEVEVGPGRNDDGIDLRVWERGAAGERGPLVLVQCKRQNDAVGKTVVKALCLDVLEEGAAKGVIVTTSRVLPGAKKHRSVRRYGMDFIERDQVREWILGMRTPGTGPFQAE